MAGAAELLEKLNEKIEGLPDRLAAAIAQAIGQGGGSVQSAGHALDRAPEARSAKKLPNLVSSSEAMTAGAKSDTAGVQPQESTLKKFLRQIADEDQRNWDQALGVKRQQPKDNEFYRPGERPSPSDRAASMLNMRPAAISSDAKASVPGVTKAATVPPAGTAATTAPTGQQAAQVTPTIAQGNATAPVAAQAVPTIAQGRGTLPVAAQAMQANRATGTPHVESERDTRQDDSQERREQTELAKEIVQALRELKDEIAKNSSALEKRQDGAVESGGNTSVPPMGMGPWDSIMARLGGK